MHFEKNLIKIQLEQKGKPNNNNFQRNMNNPYPHFPFGMGMQNDMYHQFQNYSNNMMANQFQPNQMYQNMPNRYQQQPY